MFFKVTKTSAFNWHPLAPAFFTSSWIKLWENTMLIFKTESDIFRTELTLYSRSLIYYVRAYVHVWNMQGFPAFWSFSIKMTPKKLISASSMTHFKKKKWNLSLVSSTVKLFFQNLSRFSMANYSKFLSTTSQSQNRHTCIANSPMSASPQTSFRKKDR